MDKVTVMNLFDKNEEFKRLAFNFWKTGRFTSKQDLIDFLNKNILGRTKEQYIEIVEDIITNMDKYEKKFQQTKIEQFFIEFLKLLDKYHVEMFIDQADNDEHDLRIFFDSADGVFGQDYGDTIDPDAVNGFEECVEDGVTPRKYVFPAVRYFEQKGISIKD